MENQIKHYTIRQRFQMMYLCNQACGIIMDKVAYDLSDVNCKNCLIVLKNPKRSVQGATESNNKNECDFCGKKGYHKNVLRDSLLEKKDGSDIVLCNDCLNNYASGKYEKIKLKGAT